MQCGNKSYLFFGEPKASDKKRKLWLRDLLRCNEISYLVVTGKSLAMEVRVWRNSGIYRGFPRLSPQLSISPVRFAVPFVVQRECKTKPVPKKNEELLKRRA